MYDLYSKAHRAEDRVTIYLNRALVDKGAHLVEGAPVAATTNLATKLPFEESRDNQKRNHSIRQSRSQFDHCSVKRQSACLHPDPETERPAHCQCPVVQSVVLRVSIMSLEDNAP